MVRAIKSKQPTRHSFCALRSKRFLRQTLAKRWLLSAWSQVLHGSFSRQTSQSPQSSRRNARPTRQHSSSLLEIDSMRVTDSDSRRNQRQVPRLFLLPQLFLKFCVLFCHSRNKVFFLGANPTRVS